jgi:hypothetical protein
MAAKERLSHRNSDEDFISFMNLLKAEPTKSSDLDTLEVLGVNLP